MFRFLSKIMKKNSVLPSDIFVIDTDDLSEGCDRLTFKGLYWVNPISLSYNKATSFVCTFVFPGRD